MVSMAVGTAPFCIRQHAGPYDDPFHVTRCDQPFLPRLIPKVERQNHWNDEERVVKPHTSRTVPNAKRSLANKARHAVSLHSAQKVAGSFGQDTSWIKVLLVAKRRDHRVLSAYRCLD